MQRSARKQAVAPDVELEIWVRSRLGISPTDTAVIDGSQGREAALSPDNIREISGGSTLL
jgi:hypothetical protein